MSKSSFTGFLKKFDRYSRGVSLSYKRKKTFETSVGGCCSILAFIFLFYWLAINITNTLFPPG